MRILCLDIGTKRIGLAATDPLGWTAQGLGVLARRGDAKDFAAIAELCRERDAELLLVGLPLDAEGGVGPQASRIQAFVERLRPFLAKAGLEVAIELWDERYSTAEAEARLIEADVSRKRRREVIDKMAAVAILEDYLEAHATPSADDEGALG
jgi:putative Holliday junction resolvase